MRQSVLKKLNERKGITLIFALLALLVVTLLSTTLISASLTSAHRLNDEKGSRQASIALDCAANLVRTELPKAFYYTFDIVPGETEDPQEELPVAIPESYSEGLFGDTLRNLCIGSDFYKTIPYVIEASSMPDVSVVLEKRVKNNLNGTSDVLFYATLSVADEGTSSNERSMLLEFLYGSFEGTVEVDSKSYIQTKHFCTFNKAQKETK